MVSRVWLITGTTTGIGHGAVKEVIADGDRVAAITRKAPGLSALTEEYPSDKLLVVEHDVGNTALSVETLFEKVHVHFGRIDIVVNNAGYSLNTVIEGTSDEDARSMFEVNFWGPVRITREAVKYFHEHNTPAGRVLNISSVAGFVGFPTIGCYSASKFALEGFSESFDKEPPPEWNIRIILVLPGGVRTRINVVESPFPPVYDFQDSPVRKIRELFGRAIHQVIPLEAVCRALVKISKEPNPPQRLLLGNDAQFFALQKLKETKKDIDQWDALTMSTVADDADPLSFKKHLG